MKNPHPPMKTTDPRFKKRIEALQVKLGFTGADVDGSIGHETLKRIENEIFNYTTPDDAVGTGGNSGAGSAAEEGGAVSPANPGGTPAAGKVDERSAKNIATLDPKVRTYFEVIAIEGTKIAQSMGATGYVMISGNRTYEEQNELYAKGRTAPGPVVTNAKGGYSNHNFRVAGDYGVFRDGVYLDGSKLAADVGLASRIHKAVAARIKALFPGKISWGGDWTSFRDEPHYEYKTGLTLAQMRARVAAGQPVVP